MRSFIRIVCSECGTEWLDMEQPDPEDIVEKVRQAIGCCSPVNEDRPDHAEIAIVERRTCGVEAEVSFPGGWATLECGKLDGHSGPHYGQDGDDLALTWPPKPPPATCVGAAPDRPCATPAPVGALIDTEQGPRCSTCFALSRGLSLPPYGPAIKLPDPDLLEAPYQ